MDKCIRKLFLLVLFVFHNGSVIPAANKVRSKISEANWPVLSLGALGLAGAYYYYRQVQAQKAFKEQLANKIGVSGRVIPIKDLGQRKTDFTWAKWNKELPMAGRLRYQVPKNVYELHPDTLLSMICNDVRNDKAFVDNDICSVANAIDFRSLTNLRSVLEQEEYALQAALNRLADELEGEQDVKRAYMSNKLYETFNVDQKIDDLLLQTRDSDDQERDNIAYLCLLDEKDLDLKSKFVDAACGDGWFSSGCRKVADLYFETAVAYGRVHAIFVNINTKLAGLTRS